MALSYPYALNFLSDCLNGPIIPLKLQRNDEMSGGGDGRYWSTELASPLWTASYSLYAKHAAHAREINAKVQALDGMSRAFLWRDKYYDGPAYGTTGLGSVTVSGIRADRGAISLTGAPSGFQITAGDFISINYGSGRVYFGQFAETGLPGSTREIRPYLPLGISAGVAVNLVAPRFKAIVTDFQPFANFRGRWGQDASITVLQKP